MARTDTLERVKDRALELGVYLPLGAYSRARDEIADLRSPNWNKLFRDLIGRGEDRVKPVEQRLRRRARTTVRSTERTAAKATATARKTAKKTAKRATAASTAVAPRLPRVAAPKKASELPISGYASLTAGEIVSALKGLTQTELAKVYKFERANENRSTVLEAIEGKLVELPIPTYDALTVDEILTRLDKLDESQRNVIRRYESETKARSTILDKLA